MSRQYRVLIVEDEEEQAEMFSEFLQLSGPFVIEWAPSIAHMRKSLSDRKPDILLLDYKLPDGYGLQVLEELQKTNMKLPAIMITGQGDERLAVQAMQLGAADYLVKGSIDLLRLPSLIQKTIREHNLQQSVERTAEQIRYQALLLNNVRDAVVVWNTEGKLTYWNPAAEALYGSRSKECVGGCATETYLNAFNPPVREPPREGTSGMEVERQFTTKQGKVIWVSSRVSALRDFGANNQLIGYMDVTRDITSRKQMEAQIAATQTRLAQTTRLAAIGEMASSVAHHINNPLTTIIAEAQLMLQNLPDAHPAREYAEAVEKAGWRVQKTVQQLIDYSKPATDTLEDVSINQTLKIALELVGYLIRSNNNEMEIELDEGLPPVQGNQRELSDLWINLLMLAHAATANNVQNMIQVRSSLFSKGTILVEVFHDGTPVPEDEIATYFELDMTRLNQHGTGLEISICQEIVRHHKGQITVQNNGHGTVFNVFFPVEVNRDRN